MSKRKTGRRQDLTRNAQIVTVSGFQILDKYVEMKNTHRELGTQLDDIELIMIKKVHGWLEKNNSEYSKRWNDHDHSEIQGASFIGKPGKVNPDKFALHVLHEPNGKPFEYHVPFTTLTDGAKHETVAK